MALILVSLLMLIFNYSCKRRLEKPHILLITVDTLRRDHLSGYGYPRHTSPYMDQLAKKGVKFKHVVTPMPLTAPSHASILTSLHPFSHQLTHNGGSLNTRFQTIAEVFKGNGYYTIGSVAVKILSSKYKFSQGFDSFSDTWSKKEKHHTIYERTAPSVNQSLYQQIEKYLADPLENQKPLFVWVHYFDPHFPYHDQKDVEFKNILQKNEEREGMRLYDKEIFYTDKHIQMLHHYLRKKGLLNKMVTCITADHGEEFGEHGHVNCHVDIYSENTLVPLIFQGYKIPKDKIIDTFISTMDISVTLLALANLKFDYPGEGIDLFKVIENPEKYKNRKFFVTGESRNTKSWQLLDENFGYILNFDHHFKYWYLWTKQGQDHKKFDLMPIDLKSIPKGHIVKKKTNVRILLSNSNKIGLKFVVLKCDINANDDLELRFKILPNAQTKKTLISKDCKQFIVFFPITNCDEISAIINYKNGTTLKNLKSAVISNEEFQKLSGEKKRIKNSMFSQLKTKRIKSKFDELFDLSKDISMYNNLIREKKYVPMIMKYKKIMEDIFTYYLKKGEKIHKGIKLNKLSSEDKKMLKSLGYL